MPRPQKLPRDERRTEKAETTLTIAEKDHADACARAAGLPLSSWLRNVILTQVPE